jgi:choline dehydrogenase-like flavoprotein
MKVLRFGSDETPARVEVAVIGSGPAGMTVAAELAGRGLDVLLVESGPGADHLSEIDNVGEHRVQPQALVRRRAPGGTSAVWSGRCTPLDPIDFEQRDWVAHSGWPISPAEIAPHLSRAAEILGLGEQLYGAELWALLGERPAQPLDALTERFWQFSRGLRTPSAPSRFDTDLPNDATMLTGATAVQLHHAGGRVHAVDVAGLAGHRASIAVSTVVVAGGAIETPRLLLSSGLGNDHVGRYLMDHPGVAIGHFAGPGTRAVRDRFGLYWRAASPFRLAYLNGLALSPGLQESERLLNAACWLDEHPAADDPWQAGIRLATRLRGRRVTDPRAAEFWQLPSAPVPGLVHDLWSVLRHPLLLLDGLRRLRRGRPPLYRLDGVDLYCLVEQVPDADSRVTLSARTDALGMPVARVDWKLHDEEYHAMRRLLEVVTEQFTAAGLTPPTPAPWMSSPEAWRKRVVDRAHQLGTTRMAADPSTGAVDPDGLLFGTENVWVAGGSVFPTSGHANPTLTIVALAVRLAERLSSTARRPGPAAPSR